MPLSQVEAVWVWDYNLSAQKATYGRFTDNPRDRSFTKDYLQVSSANARLLETVFPALIPNPRLDLTYKWPGAAYAGFIKFSVDRYHLSWPTGSGGPSPWRLTLSPTALGPGTFPGNPGAANQTAADAALASYQASGSRGVLVAAKLFGESDTLHIRAYLDSPPPSLAFASTSLLPGPVRTLSVGFTQRKACQSRLFSAGTLHFDPDVLRDAWSITPIVATAPRSTATTSIAPTGSVVWSDDDLAERSPFDPKEVEAISKSVEAGDFSVPDSVATVKTRGSAQRVFAKAVKTNYGNRCAITGISTGAFLVASHIVAWADDESIRTDPSNGICLSTLVDRAFDAGYLSVGVDGVVTIHTAKLDGDPNLKAALSPYQGVTIRVPSAAPPNVDYLARRLSKG